MKHIYVYVTHIYYFRNYCKVEIAKFSNSELKDRKLYFR